ncbi:hypothetical protein [Micromonospora sp. NBC_01813]|uniref:hypothetical protein n=1 Tax=Micromonospora sp. NBC_01813 TaxID=2975988 RepID=UPI002DD938BF|nr:hypothetical protein [Micromonospora sp. NBC_01813]WSA07207.1 hypothetical protein OG958_23510 [Micromonospora sp. NBC_01813]
MPHERPVGHHRVKLTDIPKRQEQRRRVRRQIIAQLTAESIELGLYDLYIDDAAEADDGG